MRRYIIAGNWKMNGSRASVAALLDGLKVGIEALDRSPEQEAIPRLALRVEFDPRELGYSFDPGQVRLRTPDGREWHAAGGGYRPLYPKAVFDLGFGVGNYIYPKEQAEIGFSDFTRLIGTGPFMPVDYVPGVSLTFERNPDWSRQLPPGPEIQAYFERTCEKYDLYRHMRFGQ